MTLWLVVIGTCAGCYLLKLAGLSAPRRLLDHPLVQRFAMAVPVALLAALITVQTVSDGGQQLVLDPARIGGIAAAAVALLLRAPFLAILAAAAATAAGLRLLGL